MQQSKKRVTCDTYKIKRKHLERSLLDECVVDGSGALVARMPASYST